MATVAEQRLLTRQGLTERAFLELVQTLVGDFDVIDLLTGLTTRCVELLDASAAGILLADGEGTLRVIGASNEQAYLLELFQIQNEQGPCLDCYRTGSVVSNADLAGQSPWPDFAALSIAQGFASVCAIPMRLATINMGCLNLFMFRPGPLSDGETALAQALADVASIAIVQDQTNRAAAAREDHLQRTLHSRIVVEQAKGMIAERDQLDMDEAFTVLRNFARTTNRRLTDVASDIIAGAIGVAGILATRRLPPPPSVSQRSSSN